MTAAEHARSVARSILAQGRFHAPSVPRPFAGVLRSIGHALTSAENALGHFAGANPAAAAVLVAAAAVGCAVLARGAVLRRGRALAVAGAPATDAPSATALAAAAARAESAGDYAAAVRLRFQAGLAALAERGALSAPATLRGAQIRRRLHSPTFDALNQDFEAVAYGGRAAAPEDAHRARAGWERLSEEVRS